MKLMMQSDDYGITPGAADGIIYGITHGVVTQTGLFSNMPWAAECVEKIRPYLDQIAFGIDLNASTGSSLLGYENVPGLCHEDGSFLTSKENRAADVDAPDHDHVDYDQVYAEFDAQVQKFIELVGKVPDYIHGHAYGTKTTDRARRAIAEKYDRPYTNDVRIRMYGTEHYGKSWYVMGGGPEAQLTEDPIGVITSNGCCDPKDEYGYIIGHCGYADAPLFQLSSFNTCRVKDLEAFCSAEVKNWIKDNNIELINFKDLPRSEWK